VCHNSACSGYAKEESFYRGWENTAAPASQERADAGKDAALTDEQRDQAAARWATANTPIREAMAFIDGFDAARAILAADKEPPERAEPRALTDEQIRRIWLIETGTTEQDSPLAILDFARAIEQAVKERK
jgi:hypothetical protein